MIITGTGSPIVVSIPEAMQLQESAIAEFLLAMFDDARVTVAARRQARPALGTTGTHNRADVVAALTELFGATPDGATLSTIVTPAPTPAIDRTSPELCAAALAMGYRVHDASDYLDVSREDAIAILSELASDDLLRKAVALCL